MNCRLPLRWASPVFLLGFMVFITVSQGAYGITAPFVLIPVGVAGWLNHKGMLTRPPQSPG